MVASLVRIAVVVLVVACGGSSPKSRVVVSETSIAVLSPISFVGADAELAPGAQDTLDAVAATLDGNPSLKLVEVEVHVTDGDAATRQAVADHRSQVIIDYLVAKHIAATRLRARGMVTPPDNPKEPVELVIVERG